MLGPLSTAMRGGATAVRPLLREGRPYHEAVRRGKPGRTAALPYPRRCRGFGLSGVGAGVGRLAYSKADEREADYLAAYITARAGYDLREAAGIWAKLAGSGGGQATAGMLDTHPAGPERLAAWEIAEREITASPERLPRPAGTGW